MQMDHPRPVAVHTDIYSYCQSDTFASLFRNAIKVTPSIAHESMLPRAPDTIPECLICANARVASTQISPNFSSNICSYVADQYTVSVRNLTTWNPSLDEKQCALQSGYSYCVRQTNETYGKPKNDLESHFKEASSDHRRSDSLQHEA